MWKWCRITNTGRTNNADLRSEHPGRHLRRRTREQQPPAAPRARSWRKSRELRRLLRSSIGKRRRLQQTGAQVARGPDRRPTRLSVPRIVLRQALLLFRRLTTPPSHWSDLPNKQPGRFQPRSFHMTTSLHKFTIFLANLCRRLRWFLCFRLIFSHRLTKMQKYPIL